MVRIEGDHRCGAIDPLQTRPEGSKIGLLSPETLDLDLKNAIFGPKFESSKKWSGAFPECFRGFLCVEKCQNRAGYQPPRRPCSKWRIPDFVPAMWEGNVSGPFGGLTVTQVHNSTNPP